MKLPQYDNRQSNTKLYSSKLDEPKGDTKFPLMFFGFPIAGVACVGLILYGLFGLLFN